VKKLFVGAFIAVAAFASQDQALHLRYQLAQKLYNNGVALKSVVREDAGLSAALAEQLVGNQAEVFYTWAGDSFHDFLNFYEYDSENHSVVGERFPENGESALLVCGTSPEPAYTYLCLSPVTDEYANWYFFNINGNDIVGAYVYGNVDNAYAYMQNNLSEPLYGTLMYMSSSSSSVSSSGDEPTPPPMIGGSNDDGNYNDNDGYFSSSSIPGPSEDSAECLPGSPDCGTSIGNGSTSSTSSSSVGCDMFEFGTLQSYFAGGLELPGADNKQIVYTKEVVDQIVEQKLQQCRQDPRSCGIDALPIIRETTDPYTVYNQVKDTPLPIKGYYLHYGSGRYDWIYVPFSLSSAYKLEKGVDEEYQLRWTPLPSGIVITKEGDSIIIH